jgi:rhodanese-related sulfurtransferase
MKHIAIAGLAALALTFAGSAAADDVAETTAAAEHAAQKQAAKADRLREVSVKELASMLADGKVVVYDANGAETRAKFGTIPEAKLLASSSEYDLAVLPADKTEMLVFYCANTRCTASDNAAKRAMEAGYTNVAVLRVGIKGWAEAGKPTTASKS